jgi:hypothetical protein
MAWHEMRWVNTVSVQLTNWYRIVYHTPHTVFDSSLPVSIILRHNGMISVCNRKLITSESSIFTKAPITPKLVSLRYSNGLSCVCVWVMDDGWDGMLMSRKQTFDVVYCYYLQFIVTSVTIITYAVRVLAFISPLFLERERWKTAAAAGFTYLFLLTVLRKGYRYNGMCAAKKKYRE